jgi:hypothetical protein
MNPKCVLAEHTLYAFHALRAALKRALQKPNAEEKSIGEALD